MYLCLHACGKIPTGGGPFQVYVSSGRRNKRNMVGMEAGPTVSGCYGPKKTSVPCSFAQRGSV